MGKNVMEVKREGIIFMGVFTLFIFLLILTNLSIIGAEVPGHNPDLDYKCGEGSQWSRSTVGCEQAVCPEGAGRTYGLDCNCGEAWGRPFRTCYDENGLAAYCISNDQECEKPPPTEEECQASCVEYHGPEAYVRDIVDGVCMCKCEEGYEEDESLVCVKIPPTEDECQEYCVEYHGPEAYVKDIVDNACMCKCKEGYEEDESLGCVKITAITSSTTITTTTTTTTTTFYEPYNPSKNYCGPEGKASGPNTAVFSQASFNFACYTHDKCYAECEKNQYSQEYCDDAFLRIMDSSCDNTRNRLVNECNSMVWYYRIPCKAKVLAQMLACRSQARLYFAGVSVLGEPLGSYSCQSMPIA
jgi:hypothetical protein